MTGIGHMGVRCEIIVRVSSGGAVVSRTVDLHTPVDGEGDTAVASLAVTAFHDAVDFLHEVTTAQLALLPGGHA